MDPNSRLADGRRFQIIKTNDGDWTVELQIDRTKDEWKLLTCMDAWDALLCPDFNTINNFVREYMEWENLK